MNVVPLVPLLGVDPSDLLAGPDKVREFPRLFVQNPDDECMREVLIDWDRVMKAHQSQFDQNMNEQGLTAIGS